MAKTKASEGGGEGEDPALIEGLVESVLSDPIKNEYGNLEEFQNGPAVLALEPAQKAAFVETLLGRFMMIEGSDPTRRASLIPEEATTKEDLFRAKIALGAVLGRELPLSDRALLMLLGWALAGFRTNDMREPYASTVNAFSARLQRGPLGDNLRNAVQEAVKAWRRRNSWRYARAAGHRLAKLIGADPLGRILPGEAWSDAALADLAGMDQGARQAWISLLSSCQAAGSRKPSARWLKEVKGLIEAVGSETFRKRVAEWFALVDRPRTTEKVPETIWEPDYTFQLERSHIDMLKGLAWASGLEADRDMARALSTLAVSALQKVPGIGPRMPALANAAIAGLGSMPGLDAVGQLARLKIKLKFIPAQREVEKALTVAADREGLPRDEIEELAVPGFGLEEVGRRREVLGDYVAELLADGDGATIRWSKAADGKAIKSVPAAVKKDHAEEVKELQGAVKDITQMLGAQKQRIDGLFLAQKSWVVSDWRERYLDHPLVGVIARRLIWRLRTGDGSKPVDVMWHDGELVRVDDQPVGELPAETKVELWHPIGETVEAVTAWREWLERHEVRQPFKQAHREVYVLTDAERNTRTYSNRFAAHILRQHQYHALAAARGWRNRLRLMVDDTYPPTSRDLPEWGLRAEFWVEGTGDEYGRDTTESGAYLYLSTDQVRFYEIGAPQMEAHAGGGGYGPGWNRVGADADAEPLALERVPSLVLSEILRDVDLFVGVASVGNDPTWNDGGPGGRHAGYWAGYSFGDLSATGQTRKAVLERIVPRLKIAPQCQFTEKFLVVRGSKRTYKIHLGSGNILMEPNDQYLCIVAKQSAAGDAAAGRVFLPFEGDNTLSIILSKALLLADDGKITDPTIVSQIGR